jgi:hypothetical protein
MKRTISIIAAATLLAALFFAGCVDVLGPDVGVSGPGTTVAAPKDGINLYIGSAGGARTLYPSAPDGGFSEYTISFTGAASAGISPNPMNNVSPTTGAIAVTGVGTGELIITVEAFAEINDDLDDGTTPAVLRKVAEGTKSFTINDADSRQCRMEVSPYAGGNPGYFAWDLDLTGLTDADKVDGFSGYAKLYTYQHSGVYADSHLVTALSPTAQVSLTLNHGASGDFTFTGTDASAGNIYQVNSGYYFMVVRLENHYQNIGWAEIVKIDSDLITKATKIFDNTSFEATKKLTGTFSTPSSFSNIEGFELLLINGNNISSVHNITKSSGVLEKTSSLAYSVIPQNVSGNYNLLVRGKDTSNGNAPTFFKVTALQTGSIAAGAATVALGSRTISLLTNSIPGPAAAITNNLNGTPLNQTITIETNGNYNTTQGDKTAWLQNAPAGVTLNLPSPASGTTMNLTLGGTPTSAARGPVQIVLPPSTIDSVPIALPVDNTAGPLEWDVLWSLTQTPTDTTNNGSFTLDISAPSEAAATGISRAKDGDTITIVPVPITAGTHPKKYIGAKVEKTGDSTVSQNVNEPNTTFTMPAYHVTVTVYFALQPGVVISFNGRDSTDDKVNTVGTGNLNGSVFSISKNSADVNNFITVAMSDSTSTLKVANWHLNGLPVTDKVQQMISGWQSGDPIDSFTINKGNLHILFDKPNNESIPTSTIEHTLTATIAPIVPNGTYYSKEFKFVVTD